MPKIIKKQHEDNPAQFFFLCPGCGFHHAFGESWQFDQNYECPTVSPSILVTIPNNPSKTKYRCHSFIKNGQIQFLNDCTHKLAGQTVKLEDANV